METYDNGFDLTSSSSTLLPGIFSEKSLEIVLGSRKFNINPEMAIFLSIKVYKHSIKASNPYIVDIDQQNGEIEDSNEEDLFGSFEKLLLLIDGATSTTITRKEAKCIAFIANSIGNQAMKCDLLPYFSLDSAAFSIRSRTLSPFAKLPTAKEFCFSVCDNCFYCPKVLAAYLSAKVCKMMLSDKSINRLEVIPPLGCSKEEFVKQFRSIFSLLSGIPVTISPKSTQIAWIINSIASQIENQEIASMSNIIFLREQITDTTSAANFLADFPTFVEFPQMMQAIAFCASNFDHIDQQFMQKIAPSILEKILCSTELRARNEDQIFQLLIGAISNQGFRALPLLEHIRFKFLSCDSIEQFLSAIKLENITNGCWKSICERLKCEVICEINDTERNRWKSPKFGILLQLRNTIDDLESKLISSEETNQSLLATQKELEKQIDCLKKQVNCTYEITGRNYSIQHYFKCITCWPNQSMGMCLACAIRCHKGHQIEYWSMGGFFCDCGAGSGPNPCKCCFERPTNEAEGIFNY